METCFCISRSDSSNHYEEDYKYKSEKYLTEEKKTLNDRICRESCFCCIYATATVTTTIATVASKGFSTPFTVPSALLTAAQTDKSRRDLAVLIKKKDAINNILKKKFNK